METRQRYLIATGNVKTEPSGGEIARWQRRTVEHHPRIPLFELVDDFRRRDMNPERSKTLLFALVRSPCIARLLTILNVRPIEVIVVDLEQIVVVRVDVVEHPLQPVTFR